MNSFYLVLMACFFQGINGKISATECVDDSEQSCKSQESRCFIPSVQFSCPQTCGVCNARCKDYKGDCSVEEMQCGYNLTFPIECPKTCAKCDVCEDLIDTAICMESLDDCTNAYMRYACRKTCLYCIDSCNDVGSEDFCNIQKLSGSCENNEVVKKMCKKTCNICEFEQC
uniref:Putative LOC100208799 [Hydra vulgaris] n=1 Tax=Lepeophtheirus salmonis TaxID=72036 RepID=A0A0K2U9U8_LEPSM